jgi:SAM-dependent methyltransferase
MRKGVISAPARRDKNDAPYTKAFFDRYVSESSASAQVVAPLVLSLFPSKSVLDVGCGTGAWLAEFARNGIEDYLGVDGAYLDKDLLRIPVDHFREVDLVDVTDFGRRFDLACCLEVAEHLPAESAGRLVGALVSAAPVVLFSAAVPGQGGTYHVNEQWPLYWANLFQNLGYSCVDCIRPKIFDDSRVEWWYSQNMLVFCEDDRVPPELTTGTTEYALTRIHPRLIKKLVREREIFHRMLSENLGTKLSRKLRNVFRRTADPEFENEFEKTPDAPLY